MRAFRCFVVLCVHVWKVRNCHADIAHICAMCNPFITDWRLISLETDENKVASEREGRHLFPCIILIESRILFSFWMECVCVCVRTSLYSQYTKSNATSFKLHPYCLGLLACPGCLAFIDEQKANFIFLPDPNKHRNHIAHMDAGIRKLKTTIYNEII